MPYDIRLVVAGTWSESSLKCRCTDKPNLLILAKILLNAFCYSPFLLSKHWQIISLCAADFLKPFVISEKRTFINFWIYQTLNFFLFKIMGWSWNISPIKKNTFLFSSAKLSFFCLDSFIICLKGILFFKSIMINQIYIECSAGNSIGNVLILEPMRLIGTSIGLAYLLIVHLMILNSISIDQKQIKIS